MKDIKLYFVALALSIVLHFVAANMFSQKKLIDKNKQQSNSNNSKQHQIKDDEDRYQHIWFKRGVVPCDTYEGIGIQFQLITGIVTYVAIDSPAYKAGLREGDEIVTPIWSIDLKFGQVLDIKIKRNNKEFIFKTTVDRICRE
jgi:C-terminal processing protease CtpA/Prc